MLKRLILCLFVCMLLLCTCAAAENVFTVTPDTLHPGKSERISFQLDQAELYMDIKERRSDLLKRSYNLRKQYGAESDEALDAAYLEMNDVIVEGPLCREPTFRRTPLGREICDVMLAVPRAFRRADYLPCILWGRTAREAAAYHTRDRILICGRLQSRVYTKLTEEGATERTTYEISALSAEVLQQG